MAAVAQRESGRLLTGWGRTTPSRARVVGPLPGEQLRALVADRPAGGVLARGAGRSYGDAAQNAGGVVLDPVTAPHIDLDADAATVRVSASTSFADLLTRIVPEGLLLPVLPGTRHLTVGGAVAADVHGKNQRSDGSLGGWIEEIELLDGSGEVRRLTPGGDPDGFRATVGGMGLTGIILGATIRLVRIRSAQMLVSTRRRPDLDALLTALDESRDRYSVAWIDTTATGRSFGWGVVAVGDHLADPDPAAEPEGLAYRPGRAHRAPRLPVCPVHRLVGPGVQRAALPQRGTGRQRTHRPGHVLPPARRARRLEPRAGPARFRGVPVRGARGRPRRHRPDPGGGAAAPLRPVPGHPEAVRPGHRGLPVLPDGRWSVAIAMPAGNRRIGPMLDDLDLRVAAAGGWVYLAGDSRLRSSACAAMYPGLPQWRAAASRLDPAGVFRSDLGQRLGLRRAPETSRATTSGRRHAG